MNINEAIKKVIDKRNLTEKETVEVFNQIMGGKATSSQIGAFLIALRMKGETVDEITGAARVMREKALKVKVAGDVVDTCGTGGTGTGVFNVSTASAFILAACGVKVAKHGNRAASSKCGSADVLEKLGVKIDIPVKKVERCINKINIGFMFAPLYHGAMKYAAPVRRELGLRTIFNVLGPLSNPASAKFQVLGVYKRDLTDIMARVLKRLGSKHVFVVHGEKELDEVTITGTTRITELKNGRITTGFKTPESFGFKKRSLDSIKGGSVSENAKIIKDVLSGKRGAKRDIVVMNASLGLVAAGKAKNIKDGVKIAEAAIDSREALEKLKELIAMTNEG